MAQLVVLWAELGTHCAFCAIKVADPVVAAVVARDGKLVFNPKTKTISNPPIDLGGGGAQCADTSANATANRGSGRVPESKERNPAPADGGQDLRAEAGGPAAGATDGEAGNDAGGLGISPTTTTRPAS